MNKAFSLIVAFVILCLLVSFPVRIEARSQHADSLIQTNPSSCPAGGCAAGQRLNISATITITSTYTGDNTQICLYALTDGGGGNPWVDVSSFSINIPSGYTRGDPDTLCSSNAPADYSVIYDAYGSRPIGDDPLSFVFRINKSTNIGGNLYLYNFQYDQGTTIISTRKNSISSIPYTIVSPISANSYVAANATACTGAPCYLNSGDDLANGIGTGLKDAVDASPSTGTINILDTYNIKGNPVTLNNPQTIQGVGDATLTYTGATCSNAMLYVTGGATIQNLNINDSVCVSPSRDLVSINSSTNVNISNNDLVNGKDAISILENDGSISVRFNQIVGNSGYGILSTAGSGVGTVKAVANNIYNNRIGVQAECNDKGEVNHNFWGSSVIESYAISNCTYTLGKRLGAAILTNSTAPGVTAQQVTLSGSKTGYFSNQISVDGTVDTKIILANHGNGSTNNIPFYENGTDAITACSNFWDVFLSDENIIPPTLVNLHFKYNLNSSCVSAIESTFFCGGSDQARYPLLWYDPSYSITNRWDSTGQIPSGTGAGSSTIGQTTTCDSNSKEIDVNITDNPNRRPNLLSDLNYTPFVVEYPIVFNEFNVISGIAKVDLYWETLKETNIKGYYVARSLNQTGPFYRASDLILAKGDSDIGGIYSYTDTGLNHGTTYWYKLEVIDTDNKSIGFNTPLSISTYSMKPTVTSMTPTSSLAGVNDSVLVTITGNNFILSSWVCWKGTGPTCVGGTRLDTTFIDSTKIAAVIPTEPTDLLEYAGYYKVSVINPSPGGGQSTYLTFIINNLAPTLTSIDPDDILKGSGGFPLTLVGTNFVCKPDGADTLSRVRWAGSSTDITITSCTSTKLIATIPASKVATAGTYAVTVYTPTPGGGTTGGQTFTVTSPPIPPVIISPNYPLTAIALTQAAIAKTAAAKTAAAKTANAKLTLTALARTTTIIPSITPTPTSNPLTPISTNQVTPEPGSATPTLAPGEPTYTPEPLTPGEETGLSEIWSWRLWSALRIFGGSLLGIGLLSIPAFLIFKNKTRNKNMR